MKLLWNLSDYIEKITHKNEYVRDWAFAQIRQRFSRTFVPQVVDLLDDPQPMIASQVPGYVAAHGRLDFAPRLADALEKRTDWDPESCIGALGLLKHEESLGVVKACLEKFPGDITVIVECLKYCGRIGTHASRDALEMMKTFSAEEEDISIVAREEILKHGYRKDISKAAKDIFDDECPGDRLMLALVAASSVKADEYLDIVTQDDPEGFLDDPRSGFEGLARESFLPELVEKELYPLAQVIARGEFADAAKQLLDKTHALLSGRYQDGKKTCQIEDCRKRDESSMFFLEECMKHFSGDCSDRELCGTVMGLFSACFLTVAEREFYLKVLDPEAAEEVLMDTLKLAGDHMPQEIVKDASAKLSAKSLLLLWEELEGSGNGLWLIRAMGDMGDRVFVHVLVDVLKNEDPTGNLYMEAYVALKKLDENSYDDILREIGEKNISDPHLVFDILDGVPTEESFDLAKETFEKKLKKPSLDDLEHYGLCLGAIGDKRGISEIQELMTEAVARYLGAPLEILADLHGVDVPELMVLESMRQEDMEAASAYEAHFDAVDRGVKMEGDGIHTVRREGDKVGRNDPCPCGSGKKYKKCCL